MKGFKDIFRLKFGALAVISGALFFSNSLLRAEKPNLIVIMADDLGYSDLSCYGGEIETPNLDQLAMGGIRFTGFKNTARCAPSRASLLTGRYQHSVGVGRMTANDFERPGYRGQLSTKAPTLAEIFKSQGYGTGMVGKWHLTVHDTSSKQKRLYPCDRGFDHFYGTWWGAKDYFNPQFMMKNHEHIDENTQYPDDFYLTHALSDSAIEFVESQHDQNEPFFLYLAHYAPHAPIQAPEDRIQKCRKRYKAGFVKLQKERFERQQKLGVAPKNAVLIDQGDKWNKLNDKHKNTWVNTMATYAAMIEIMDDGIGQLVDVLKKNGQYDNTLIVFLSDNGSTPERKNVGAHFCASLSNTPFSGVKAQTLEGGLSSPLIISWPKKLEEHAGQVRHGHCHIIDLLPTCLEATGISFPDVFNGMRPSQPDGTSLMAAVKGKELEQRPFFWEHGRSCAIYKDGWKLVANRHPNPWKLFDLTNDPAEKMDLSKEYPERVDSLKAHWEKWGEKYDVIPFPGEKKRGKEK
jgi:arylsulfatase